MVSKLIKNICAGALLLGFASSIVGARPATRQEIEDKQLRDAIAASMREQRGAVAQRPAQPAVRRPAQMSFEEQMAEALRQSQEEGKAVAARPARPIQRPAQLSEEEELARVLAISAAEAEEKEGAAAEVPGAKKSYALVIKVFNVPTPEKQSFDNFQRFIKNKLVDDLKAEERAEKGVAVFPFAPKLKDSGKPYPHLTFLVIGDKPGLKVADLKREILKALNDATSSISRGVVLHQSHTILANDPMITLGSAKAGYVVLDVNVPAWLETMAQSVSADLGNKKGLGLDVSKEHYELYAKGSQEYKPHVSIIALFDKNQILPAGYLAGKLEKLQAQAATYKNPFTGNKIIGELHMHRIALTSKVGPEVTVETAFVYNPITHKWHEGR